MKKSLMIAIVFAAALFFAGAAWGQAPAAQTGQQQESGTDQSMQGPGKMEQGKGGHGMMQGHGMKGGGMGGCGMMGGGMDGCGMMGGGMGMSFHRWVKNFMAHKELLNLSDKQTQQINTTLSDQMKSAIKIQSEIQTMRVDLAQAIEKDPAQSKTIRNLLEKMAGKQVDLQMESLQTYSKILKTLDANQKKKVAEVAGSPFSMPWQQMPMGDSGASGETGGAPEEQGAQ